MTTRDFPSFVDQLPLTRRALEFASSRHRHQRRASDHAPFILHPLEVAHLLWGRGCPDHVVAAGVLHDVLENTPAGSSELARLFGREVAALVCAVTEPAGGGGYAERKARLRSAMSGAEPAALVIFAADKVAKVRELRLGLVGSPDGRRRPEPDRLEHYWGCLELLERRMATHPLVRQLRFELEALALLPPEGWGGGAPGDARHPEAMASDQRSTAAMASGQGSAAAMAHRSAPTSRKEWGASMLGRSN